MTTKEIKDALMEAITKFVIAVKDGKISDSSYNMGLVHAYIGVLGEFARLGSPWESFWREALGRICIYLIIRCPIGVTERKCD